MSDQRELDSADVEELRDQYGVREDPNMSDLTDAGDMGEATPNILLDAGYDTPQSVINATPDELSEIKGIGPSRIEAIKGAAQDVVDQAERPWRDRDLVESLYVDERLSQSQVAEVLDCDRTTAFRWIHRHGLSSEDAKPWTDEDYMFRLYVDEKMSESEISEELGCSQMTVSNWLHKHGIQPRGPSGEVGTEGRLPYRNEHVLLDRLESGDTIRKMADDFDCSTSTVRYWIDKFDIDAEEIRERATEDAPWRDPDRLRDAVEQYEFQDEMAAALGCDQSTVSRWMDKYGIDA